MESPRGASGAVPNGYTSSVLDPKGSVETGTSQTCTPFPYAQLRNGKRALPTSMLRGTLLPCQEKDLDDPFNPPQYASAVPLKQ